MFWHNFVRLCNERGRAPNAIARKLGVASATVSHWKRGGVPRDTTAQRLADYFGVPLRELFRGTVPKEDGINEREHTLLVVFRSATEEQRMRIIQAVLNIRDGID